MVALTMIVLIIITVELLEQNTELGKITEQDKSDISR